MKTQQQFLNYLKELQTIIQPINIADKDILNLQQNIAHTELIVPVVGGFSAGKSTLINSFLGTDILPTGITPETALATELRYSASDYIEAVRADNDKVERYEVSEIGALRDRASEYQYIRLYLNSEPLKRIAPLVLVDMPGFDSPIENHNRAILNYINKGCYFVFLTSVEDGNITRSMVREVENIQHFAKEFSFCLSKTNLKSAEDVQEIQQFIKQQVADYFDYDKEIILLDNNGGKNLQKILEGIDPETLFHSLFIDGLRTTSNDLINTINVTINTLKNKKEESDDAIAALEESIDSIQRKKQEAIENIEHRYGHQSVDMIIKRVSETLMDNKDYLVNIALNKKDAFAQEVNDLVKNTLLREVQNQFQNIGQNIIEDISINIKNSIHAIEGFEFSDDFLEKLQVSATTMIQKSSGGFFELAEKMKDHPGAAATYRIGATILAITTSIITPLLEILVVFLPDIIAYFAKDKMKEDVEGKLTGSVIPQIKVALREQLPALMRGHINQLIETISNQFEEQVQKKRDEIQQAVALKENKASELSAEMAKLEKVREAISTLENQCLF